MVVHHEGFDFLMSMFTDTLKGAQVCLRSGTIDPNALQTSGHSPDFIEFKKK